MKTTAAHNTAKATTPSDGNEHTASGSSNFLVLLFDMSWKLAIVVLVPILAGVKIDKNMSGDSHTFLFVGLALAVLGSIAVMWQSLQTANKLPVPKLSSAQKAKIQKRYEEDDADV